MTESSNNERLRRWRLILGSQKADGTGCKLTGTDAKIDKSLDALYDSERSGGLGSSSPKALAYCQSFIQQPQDTILVLISDLYEGGDRRQMLKRVAAIINSGVQLVTLLALNDEGVFHEGSFARLSKFSSNISGK